MLITDIFILWQRGRATGGQDGRSDAINFLIKAYFYRIAGCLENVFNVLVLQYCLLAGVGVERATN
jgi:hypothetical protein